MTVTIKQANLSRVLTAAHSAVAETATQYGIRPLEMRVLMFVVDHDGEIGQGVESVRIAEKTGITGSNVRRALYDLHHAGMIAFTDRRRGTRLVAPQTAPGP